MALTVTMKRDVLLAGAILANGSTQTLADDVARQFVYEGRATLVSPDPSLQKSLATIYPPNDSAQQPMTPAYVLSQAAIPMVLPSSGTVGANGALSGITALPYATFPQPAYLYFPAGALYAGSVAGMYYASITSATTATVYNNLYASGAPTIPATPTPIVAAGPGAYTQTISTDITLASVTVPGGSMGANGALRTTSMRSVPAVASNKFVKTLFGGLDISSSPNISGGTQVVYYDMRTIRNRGVQNSQVCISGWTSFGFDTSPFTRTTVNTSADVPVAFAGQLASASDFIILEGYTVEVLPRA